MRLGEHTQLDAVCGEYLVGTLRGAARRRFERALVQEPLVARRLHYWQRSLDPRYADDFVAQPSPSIWRLIRRDLELDRFGAPWYARIWLWQMWAAGATAALLVVLALPLLKPPPLPTPPIQYSTVAILTGKAPQARVTAELSADRRLLRLMAERPVQASPAQSFELWLVPVGGGLPLSVAVVGELDATIELKASLAARLARGAKLAISVEPAGGSPTDGPSGSIILIGDVES